MRPGLNDITPSVKIFSPHSVHGLRWLRLKPSGRKMRRSSSGYKTVIIIPAVQVGYNVTLNTVNTVDSAYNGHLGNKSFAVATASMPRVHEPMVLISCGNLGLK